MQKKAVDVDLVLVFSYLFFYGNEIRYWIDTIEDRDRRLVISFIDIKSFTDFLFLDLPALILQRLPK